MKDSGLKPMAGSLLPQYFLFTAPVQSFHQSDLNQTQSMLDFLQYCNFHINVLYMLWSAHRD